MAARRAGQHARQTARRLAVRWLVGMAVPLAAGGVALVAFGLLSPEVFVTELVVLAAVLAIERFAVPTVERWDRGASGEEEIGRLLEELEDGWLALHDVHTGHGNIDHVVIGPGGLFTIETKSHGGRISVDRIERRMLGQACVSRPGDGQAPRCADSDESRAREASRRSKACAQRRGGGDDRSRPGVGGPFRTGCPTAGTSGPCPLPMAARGPAGT